MADFTHTQGRYLAFISAYTDLHGYPPAESEIAAALCVSPPSVNQMVRKLEKLGLILRQPGQPRSLQILVPEHEIPSWQGRKKTKVGVQEGNSPGPVKLAPPANLYVVTVILMGGPLTERFANNEISRVIEIRGDQTLHDLHLAIFKAYDRWDDHLYEFQFGKRPHDPNGPNFRSSARPNEGKSKDALAARIDDLELKPGRVFGYWFDFGDDWFHQVQVERVEEAIPTVTYPRVIKRKGKSPPQYPED